MKLFGDKTPSRNVMLIGAAVVLLIIVGLVVVLTRPSAKPTSTPGGSSSSVTSSAAGANMAGASQDVVIAKGAVDAKPVAWDLSTPQKAIVSYLDWTSYAYRTATSTAASPTMSTEQGVRIDSYIQYNIQQKRLLDQHLDSITFGTLSKTATATLVPAQEKWSYNYISIAKAGQVVGGPYTASYDTTYTVTQDKSGTWVVADVAATALGAVK